MDAGKPVNPRVIPTLTQVVNPFGDDHVIDSELSQEMRALVDRCVDQVLEQARLAGDQGARMEFQRLATALAERLWLEADLRWQAGLRDRARAVVSEMLEQALSRRP